jgi:hypothetical protein
MIDRDPREAIAQCFIRYVPVCDLLALDVERESDQKKLQALAKDVKSDGLCAGMDAMEVYTRLERVRKIRTSKRS